MKVVFMGVLEVRSGGCKPCGAKRASKKVMATRREYILPSGETRMFFVGRETCVSDSDGEFLLKSFPDAFKEV